jgi:hypothetical protein
MPMGFKVVGWLVHDADKDIMNSYLTYIKKNS